MTSIYDVPYEDIQKFLLVNNKNYIDKDDAYDKTLTLLKDKNSKGHTISIIEWMIAHNLLIRNINIPNYTSYKIDNMSQNEINELAKLLTMKGNNRENIKNILRYLGKLNENILLPEINEFILSNLNQLDINEINFDELNFTNIIKLLKTHRNKNLIRKMLYNNMENMILYNIFYIDFKQLDRLDYIQFLLEQTGTPKRIILELINNNKQRLLKNYTKEDIDKVINYVNEQYKDYDDLAIDIYQDIRELTKFLVDLVKIDEIALAKTVFEIINKYKFEATLIHTHYTFIQYLIANLGWRTDVGDKINVLFDFIGNENIITSFNYLFNRDFGYYIKKFLKILIITNRFEVFLEILNLLTKKNHKRSGQAINILLPKIKQAIELNDNLLLFKYLDIINLALDGYLTFSFGPKFESEINALINKAEKED